jgi:uncharacterized protein YjiS (DUF1127 family)
VSTMKSYAFIELRANSILFARHSPDIAGWIDSGLALLRTFEFRLRSRRELARLDPRQLADIGLDPVAAGREAAKPFWRS